MALNLKHTFMRAATGLAALAFAVGVSVPAYAHVHNDPSDPVSQELMQHMDWIMAAKSKTGGDCCHERDVIADLDETIDADGNYLVTIKKGTKIYTGTDANTEFFLMPKDMTLKIEPYKVLDPETADKACKDTPTPTCTPPTSLNVLFAYPDSLRSGDPSSVSSYCYLPRPPTY